MPSPRYVSKILDPDDEKLDGHDFLNIDVLNDNELFLDPLCIAASQQETCVKVRQRCRAFLETLLEAMRTKNAGACTRSMEHVGERPEFRLGYCERGGDGRGIGHAQASSILKNLSKSKAVESGVVEDLLDVANLVSGVGQDKVSDLIANIACADFAAFTERVLSRYDSPPTTGIVCHSWSPEDGDWIESHHLVVRGNTLRVAPIILVPRQAVARKRAVPSFASYLLKEKRPLGDLFAVFGKEPPEYLYKESIQEKIKKLGVLAKSAREDLNVALAISEQFRSDYRQFKKALVQKAVEEMRSNT